MEFINPTVNTDLLPKAAGVNWQPLEQAYLKALRIQLLIGSGIALAILIIVLFLAPISNLFLTALLAGGLWLIISVGTWFLQSISFKHKAFALREHDILFRSGWLFRTIAVCPFNRVQHCAVSSGPIDRRFNLASLKVFTAGSAGDIMIPGLLQEKAFIIKEFLTQKIDSDEPAAESMD
ncbi:MAG TPA: PH domain-containing protein [Parasegetibacter sp.]